LRTTSARLRRVTTVSDAVYYRGQAAYHSTQSCSGATAREPVSLIDLTRLDLSRCRKCEPPELPAEYAVCHDCGWESPVDECERDRGYLGACPACGSAKTSSQFRPDDTEVSDDE